MTDLKIISSSDDQQIGHCEKHGAYPLKKFVNKFNDDVKWMGSCQKCEEEKRVEEIENRTAYRIKGFLSCSGIPERFKDYSFDDFKTGSHAGKKNVLQSIKDYAQDFTLNREKGRCMTWCGAPGTGKTMLSCCMAKAIIHKTYSAYEHDEHYGEDQLVTHDYMAHITTEYVLIRKIKNSWGSGAGLTEESIISNLCEPDLLAIDEVGVSFGSEAEKILLYQVINSRYERTLPTILISNLNHTDLEKHCGSRIMDRMRENQGIQLTFNWESYRR